MSDRDAIWRFAEHVAGTDYEDLPESAAVATRTFLLDTLGVGVAGSARPWTGRLIETQRLSCPGEQARVWSDGAYLSAAGAAVCNAYQIHNGEFDCVHEGAVVHTFTVPVAAALAWAEREGGVGGRDFLTGLALGVDVACHLGVASKSPLRFFRTATAGAFAAAAAIGRLAGFDAPTLVNAFGAVLGQLSGTMQAHVAASALLRGRVVPKDFRPAALRDPDILELARRVDVIVDGNPDPNALVPVTVEVNLRDGRSDTERVDVMYGNPARPMTRVAQLEKFGRNCAAAAWPIAPEAAERVIAAVARLESLSDVTALVDDLVPAPTTHPPLA